MRMMMKMKKEIRIGDMKPFMMNGFLMGLAIICILSMTMIDLIKRRIKW
jgi:hypothetical protein